MELLAPKPGDTVIDLCAAPGGKTCCAAELMRGEGRIFAFDIYPHRVALIEKEARRLGFSVESRSAESSPVGRGAGQTGVKAAGQPFITLKAADSAVFMPEMEGAADCVIADVPCSGLGTLRRNPEIKLKEQSAAEATKSLEELTKIQYNIMLNSARYLKNGGRLLYSTCTVDPLENGELVRRVLSELGSRQQCQGETQPATQPLRLSIEKELQLFPQKDGPDGFYICVLKRR